jgi:hypothetical protein
MGYLKVFFYEIAFLMGKMQGKALKKHRIEVFSLWLGSRASKNSQC